MLLHIEAGQAVLPRQGSVLRRRGVVGRTTGRTRACQLEGCPGIRIVVRWPGRKITYPCSKAMRFARATAMWEIE